MEQSIWTPWNNSIGFHGITRNIPNVTTVLPCHILFLPTTPPHHNHCPPQPQQSTMPPRTRADDKASRSSHIHAHTPVRKRGPSNAGDQASKCQKKHQGNPESDKPAQPKAVMRGMKAGKKRGGKSKKGRKPRCVPHPRCRWLIDNADGPRLQENEHPEGGRGCQTGIPCSTHPVSPSPLFFSCLLTFVGPSGMAVAPPERIRDASASHMPPPPAIVSARHWSHAWAVRTPIVTPPIQATRTAVVPA